jgi:hypothetical protein
MMMMMMVWSSRWNAWQRKPMYSEEICPSDTLFTTNPTRPDPGSNHDRRVGKPAAKPKSYETAKELAYCIFRI